MPIGKLMRSETDRKIAGVAGGMAVYFGIDPTLVRVGWVVAGIMGWGLIAYGILWLVLPKRPGTPGSEETAD
jgi:phage shock protein C